MSLLLEIVTPEARVYSQKVASVVLPAVEGYMGVLPGHVPILAALNAGELEVVEENGGREFLAIDRGFAEILGDKVSVLTEGAINVEEIDVGAVEEAQARAEKALAAAQEQGMAPEVLEQLETQARFAVIQKLARERRR